MGIFHGLEDLQDILSVEGIKDHLVRAGADDSENTKWSIHTTKG